MSTYAELITQTAFGLKQAGIDNSRREARLLVALAAELDTAKLIAIEPDEVSDAGVLARLDAFTKRRCAHEPFAHIAGRRGFYGLSFICDARALVPRPDSERVVETVLELLPRGRGVRVADLGTGSGCLLSAILHTRGGVKGTGVERDPKAASLARENIKRLGLEARAEIRVCSWEAWRGWGEVDLIVSNPPYITPAEIEILDDDVRLYDPREALDGGEDGLEAYRSILGLAAKHMKPGAWLVFEIGYDQKAAVTSLMKGHEFTQIGSARDLGGNDRVVFGRRREA